MSAESTGNPRSEPMPRSALTALEDAIIAARPTVDEIFRLAMRSGLDRAAIERGRGTPAMVNQLVDEVRTRKDYEAVVEQLPIALRLFDNRRLPSVGTAIALSPTGASLEPETATLIYQSWPRLLDPKRVDHFANTVTTPVPVEILRGSAPDDQWNRMTAGGITRIPVWGFHEKYRSGFKTVLSGDQIVFHDKRRVWASATVTAAFEGKAVTGGLINWGRWEPFQGDDFPLIVALEDVRTDLELSDDELGAVVPSLPRPYTRLFSRVPRDELEQLRRRLTVEPASSAEPARPALEPLAGDGDRLRILVVATEWASGKGGVSTFNRGLCIALARSGASVECLFGEDSSGDAPLASDVPVAPGDLTVTPVRVDPRLADHSQALAVELESAAHRRLDRVDVVIGHGHITGPAAAVIRQQRYPDAMLAHIVHTNPERVAAFKAAVAGARGEVARCSAKMKSEQEQCKAADVLCGVGPKLTHTAKKLLNATGSSGRRIQVIDEVVELLPGYNDEPLNEIPP